MSRRKEPAIPADLLDQLLAGSDAAAVLDQGGLLDSLKKALAERALNVELDHHLGDETQAGNSRNGYGRKTVVTDIRIDDPGCFECLAQIVMDDRPGIGIGIVDRDLLERQPVLRGSRIDTGEGQRAGRIEPERLQVARDQGCRRSPARGAREAQIDGFGAWLVRFACLPSAASSPRPRDLFS